MDGKKKLVVCRDEEELADFAVKEWKEAALNAVRERGRFNAAVSGGETPRRFYRSLARLGGSLPWSATHIFWADERFVPPDDRGSNYLVVKEALLSRIALPPAHVHQVPTAGTSAPTSAAAYEADIRSHFHLESGQFPEFDLIVLGLGTDGHTASLFPGRPSLSEKQCLAVAELSPPLLPVRISLTLPVLDRAGHLLFLVSGKEKATVLQRVVEENNCLLPAALIRPLAGELIFAVDASAASQLHRKA